MFIGSSREGDVDALVEAYEHVAAGGGSRMVVLEAPTWWGKTRVVQELYARMAADQSAPAYWPARLEGEDSGRWVTSRKRVHPLDVVVPAGAVLPWMWWGVSCSLRQDGRPAQALFDDATQLAAHAGSLYDPMKPGTIASTGFDGTNALIAVLGGLGLAVAAPVGIPLMVGGWRSRCWITANSPIATGLGGSSVSSGVRASRWIPRRTDAAGRSRHSRRARRSSRARFRWCSSSTTPTGPTRRWSSSSIRCCGSRLRGYWWWRRPGR